MPILGVIASGISGHLTPPWSPEGAYDALSYILVPSGGVSQVQFGNIPTGYKHLEIRALTFSSSIDQNLRMQFNADASSNYSRHSLNSNNTSTPLAYATAPESYIAIGGTGDTTYGYASINTILDYSSTQKNKTVRSINGSDRNGSGYVSIHSGLWINTSPITSITISSTTGTITQNSSYALYGVK